MTLLTSTFAAIIFTIFWYKGLPNNELQLHVPCFLFWGSSLMWMIDGLFGFMEDGADYFLPAPVDMLNDLFLGLSVVAIGMIIWLVFLIVKDPKGVIKSFLLKRK